MPPKNRKGKQREQVAFDAEMVEKVLGTEDVSVEPEPPLSEEALGDILPATYLKTPFKFSKPPVQTPPLPDDATEDTRSPAQATLRDLVKRTTDIEHSLESQVAKLEVRLMNKMTSRLQENIMHVESMVKQIVNNVTTQLAGVQMAVSKLESELVRIEVLCSTKQEEVPSHKDVTLSLSTMMSKLLEPSNKRQDILTDGTPATNIKVVPMIKVARL